MMPINRLLLAITISGLWINSPVLAEKITSDNTVKTKVSRNGNTLEIRGGTKKGNNLFHSFQEFSVPKGMSADFQNSSKIKNIISRVTGIKPSEILGIIRANGNANLILINPNGIVFGKGAQIQIGGSFLGSTANSVVFEDGNIFTADSAEEPLLTVSVPVGVQFNSINPPIQVQGTNFGQKTYLQTLALVGGDISIKKTSIEKLGIKIELGGLASPGTVNFSEDFQLDFPQNVELSNIDIKKSTINVIGNGGSIDINSRNLIINQSSLRAGIPDSEASSSAQAGNIDIRANGTIRLMNGSQIENSTKSLGNGGDINITADSLNATQGSRLLSSTSEKGNAGDITITAAKSIHFDGVYEFENAGGTLIRLRGIRSEVSNQAEGRGGDVNINTNSFTLTNGADINSSTGGSGDVGDIKITTNQVNIDGFFQSSIDNNNDGTLDRIASGFLNVVNSQRLGENPITGSAGDIIITTDSLQATNGSTINANTFSEGNAGDITITATKGVYLNGSRGIQARVNNEGSQGRAGNISITTPILELTQGSQIAAGTDGRGNAGNITINASERVYIEGNESQNGGILSQVRGTAQANGGNIFITTPILELKNVGISARTTGIGDAGKVTINADKINLVRGTISSTVGRETIDGVEHIGQGKGGAIIIDTGVLQMTQGSTITTSTNGIGDAGRVRINATEEISLDGFEINETGEKLTTSITSTEQEDGQGKAGTITINTPFLSLSNEAQISTESQSSGGGSIKLEVADLLEMDNLSLISATAKEGTGNGGNITIDSLLITLSDHSEIIAEADEGIGGIININTKGVFVCGDCQISADSNAGIDGTVAISSFDQNNFEVENVPEQVNVPAVLLVQSSCRSQVDTLAESSGNLIIQGRSGFPSTPKEPQSDRNLLSFADTASPDSTNPPSPTSQLPTPARGWYVNLEGKVILTSQIPIAGAYGFELMSPDCNQEKKL